MSKESTYINHPSPYKPPVLRNGSPPYTNQLHGYAEKEKINTGITGRKRTGRESFEDSESKNQGSDNKKPKLSHSNDGRETELEEVDLRDIDPRLKNNKALNSQPNFFYNQISKENIRNFISKAISTNISSRVLTDITGEHFLSVGRPHVDGSSTKQMRHVTPYSFLEKLISANVNSSPDKKSLIHSLGSYINLLISDREGASVSKNLLETEEYLPIADKIRKFSSKSIAINSEEHYLVSPSKVNYAFNTPTRKAIAMQGFAEKNTQFTQIAINALCNSIREYDENTLTILAEELCRLLFTIFNGRPGVAYPAEGNTSQQEIRYYETKEDAEAGNKNYTVIKPREINSLINQGEDLNWKLRLADAEGSRVQRVKKALDVLTELLASKEQTKESLNDDSFSHLIEEYNDKYNEIIKLTNSDYGPFDEHLRKYNNNLGEYNNNLDEECFTSNLYAHIAKQLFLVFDYKALEQEVFVFSHKNFINSYSNASGNRTTKRTIKDGDNYREHQVEDASGYNDSVIFRNEEKLNIKNLTHKIVEHVAISMFSYKQFDFNIDKFNKVLDEFSALMRMEYELEEDKYSELSENAKSESTNYFDIFDLEYNPDIKISFADGCFKEIIGDQLFDENAF